MRFLLFGMMLLSAVWTGQAQGTKGGDETAAGVNDQYDFIDVNRMLMWISNNGSTSHDPGTDGNGCEWPRGSAKFVVYEEGLVIGGMVSGEPRVGGSTYRHGLHAGHIMADGSASDPGDPTSRIFKAHRFDAAWWDGLSQAEQDRFLADLREWPVMRGAPWVDANANGIYDPDPVSWAVGGPSDTPFLPGDEVLWFVSNDLDPARTASLYGSSPVGLEVHTMVWASTGHPLLENVVFREYTIINKGVPTLEDTYLGLWEDVDLGSPFDDLVGVDTTLGLQYDYNGTTNDGVYGIPPATGVVWLQTPVVPAAGRTARFGLGSRDDYRNLPLSAFAFYVNSSPVYQDPDLGNALGSRQMLNQLSGRAYDGSSYVDPVAGGSTTMPLAGDPVLHHGWIDGIVDPAGDRRGMSSSGMFTLAPGDTQKVVVARVVAEGQNHLLSVRALRNAARQLHDIYRNLPVGATAPVFASTVRYPTSDSYAVHVSGGPFPAGMTQVEGVLRGVGDIEIQRVTLFDDGTHGDGAPADGVYGGTLSGTSLPSGADLLVVTGDGSLNQEWFVEGEIALPGAVSLSVSEVSSDSRNYDGHVNPGENVRLRLRIDNHSGTGLGPWHLFLRDDISLLADQTEFRYDVMTGGGRSFEPSYDAKDGNSYLGLTIPDDMPPGTVLRIPITIISENRCLWNDTLTVAVEEFAAPPIEGLLAHVQGKASGSLGYRVVDRAALTDHDYRVSVEGEDFGTKTLVVEDLTLGTTLFTGLPMPDRLAHDGSTFDGWRLNSGTAMDELYYDQAGEIHPSFEPTVTGEFSEPSRAWFAPYAGFLLTGEEFFGSTVRLYDQVPVRLVFDRTNGQQAMAWLRGVFPNYAYQGYYPIPVRAYDISDSTQPRQLMVGFVEQVDSPERDNTWRPSVLGGREYLFVFADDYSATVDPKFQNPLLANSEGLDVLYGLWAVKSSPEVEYQDGDSYTITPNIPVSNRDVYIFPKPRLLGIESAPTHPAAIALHPAYPNPVGSGAASASAEIRFDIPREGNARLSVFDMLGRCVAVLVDQALPAGTHTVRLDAAGLRAGTYVVALDVRGERVTRLLSVVR